ncbi:SWIM zinc finger family protein [Halalkalicoccus sp. NIPERK01]|uniref:SWIM zinc finger family protein n=1 Tax=Halalkalicoccus sp. NIPERK01 TaxID=3053469 RepID=UPI00256ED9AE|nr:SWIM zinc finger family protein [Halalkalicoccus sp. NIPERK01]MDL5363525.1 SWIM zinc finger family protein [Halalkalicoccus sp. NIPERK01]
MTQARNTPASLPTSDSELDRRSIRARAEPMTVTALGDALYEVETDHEVSYLVDLDARRCSCPDYTFRSVRCKHLRRVAIEITEGRTPPPGRLAVECATCGEELFVPEENADRSHYCEDHALEPGAFVRDRETGDRLLVVSVSDRRADRVRIGESAYSVATYPNNRAYDPADPVVGAVYPQSVTMTERGPEPDALRVYSFPRSRLDRVDQSNVLNDLGSH